METPLMNLGTLDLTQPPNLKRARVQLQKAVLSRRLLRAAVRGAR